MLSFARIHARFANVQRLSGCAQQWRSWLSFWKHTVQPPLYPQHPVVYRIGSTEVVDQFSWLSRYEDAEGHLRKEQQYFQHVTKPWQSQTKQFLSEMKHDAALMQLDDPPEVVGAYQYRMHCNPTGQDTIARQCSSTGQQQVLLSAAVMRADATAATRLLSCRVQGYNLGSLKLSQDQQLLAYTMGLDEGSHDAVCLVKDLNTGLVRDAFKVHPQCSFEWSADAHCLYHTTADGQGRPSQVWRRTPGEPGTLIYTEHDPKHFVALTRTKDWSYLLINSHSKLSSEVHVLDASQPDAMPMCIQPRTPGWEYFVEHWHGHLLLLTNKLHAQTAAASEGTAAATATSNDMAGASGGDYSLVSVPAAAVAGGSAGAEHWQLLLPEQADRAITDMDVFDRCVVLHHTGSQPLLSILELEVQPSHSQQHHHCRWQQQGNGQLRLKNQKEVSLPDWVFAIRPGINQDHLNTSFRLYASSPAVPEVPLQLDLTTGHLSQLPPRSSQQLQSDQQQHQQHGHPINKQQGPASHSLLPALTCQRLWATAGDGVQVPITLVHQQGLPFDGSAPLLLEVYGAYGQVLEADYKVHRLPLLRRGWSVALAHVRGGGELGRRWHAAGRQKTKRNSVQDLLSCLQLLFSMQVTSRGLVAGHAASAGALTLAAAVNAEPSWFAAVVLECPFLELCSPVPHALDEHEQDEWGDPKSDAAAADVVAGLCPYNNLPHIDVASGRFPAVLATAGLQDTRVPFCMPVKYVARLRSLQAAAQQYNSNNSRPVLLQFDKNAGHFDMGVSGGVMQDVALQHAFLCNALLQRAALPPSAMHR